MLKLRAVLYVILLLHCNLMITDTTVYGQVTEAWVVSYDGPMNYDYDTASAMVLDEQGNIYVTGSAEMPGCRSDYGTVKYENEGNQIWVAYYDGPVNHVDNASALALDMTGNVYVTGSSRGSGYDDDCATVKYDSDGNQIWVARYDGPANDDDYAVDIAVDTVGNVYLTGTSCKIWPYDYDYVTIKYDPLGDEMWIERYRDPGGLWDYAHDLVLDPAGNVFVTGDSWGSGTYPDYASIKYSPDGNRLGVRRYNGPANGADRAYAIALDEAGNICVTGESEGGSTHYDYLTIKYDAFGNRLWRARYTGPVSNGWDRATAIAIDAEGNVYVTGSSDSQGGGFNDDYLTIKYDPDGNQLWEARYDNPSDDQEFNGDVATAIALDEEGNVYVTGVSYGGGGFGGTFSDFATIKYDTDGNMLWVARYGDYKTDGACSIAVDENGGVYVTGSSSYFDGEDYFSDYITIKYVPGSVSSELLCLTPTVMQGDTLVYEGTIINHTSIVQTFKAWTKVRLPNGEWYNSYVIPPTPLSMEPYDTLSLTMKHSVPMTAPPGEYEYWGYIGADTSSEWDSDMFDFTVEASGKSE